MSINTKFFLGSQVSLTKKMDEICLNLTLNLVNGSLVPSPAALEAWYACLKCHWCSWHWYVCMLDDLSTAGVAQVACRNLDMDWLEAGYFCQLVVSVLTWCCFLALAVHLVQPFLPRFWHGMSFAGHKLWMSWPSSTAITVLPLHSILVPLSWFPISLLAFLYM